MKSTRSIFFKYLSAISIAVIHLLSTDIADAAVVQRGRVGVSRAPVARKASTPQNKVEPDTPVLADTDTVETPEPTPSKPIDLSDITISAADNLSKHGESSDDDLAQEIQRQKEKLAAAEENKQNKINNTTISTTANQCNDTLRKCMAEKCGDDFTDCANDSTAQLDAKLSACRGNSKCSGTEYDLFSNEILADIDANRVLGTYGQIMSCGNEYNGCIVEQCGQNFEKCLALSDGNDAIDRCKYIIERCERYDNGLAARALSALAELRVDAEEQIASDEARLYALRDEMSAHCDRMGAAFDERTLNCIYSIEFIAGSDSTIFASKKALAGSTFICEPDWFGIDITTFRENVYRHVRQQSSATAGMLGAGVGIAGGAISSGAIGRAIETTKAKNATKAAEKEHKETHGKEPAEPETEEKTKNNKSKGVTNKENRQKNDNETKSNDNQDKKTTKKEKTEKTKKCRLTTGAAEMTLLNDTTCIPKSCKDGDRYKLEKENTADAKCVDQVGKECACTDPNAETCKNIAKSMTDVMCVPNTCNSGYRIKGTGGTKECVEEEKKTPKERKPAKNNKPK